MHCLYVSNIGMYFGILNQCNLHSVIIPDKMYFKTDYSFLLYKKNITLNAMKSKMLFDIYFTYY